MSFLDSEGREYLSWVDAHLDRLAGDLYQREPLGQDWARISKVAEELGEVIGAFIIHTGQNPRKPQADMLEQVKEELADTALTAIFCLQHFTKDSTETADLLEWKLGKIYDRAREVEQRASRLGL